MLAWCKNRLWPILWTTVENWVAHEGFMVSAAMAYYAAFSLFPMCLVLIAALGYVSRVSARFQDSQQQLLSAIAQNTSPWLADQVQLLLDGVQTKAQVGGPIGLVTLVLGAIGVFSQLDNMVSRIWESPPNEHHGFWGAVRSALYDRWVAFMMLVTAGVLVLILFVANMVLSGLQRYAVQLPGGNYLWRAIQLSFTVGVNTLVFASIFKFLPKVPVRWTHAVCGALLVACVWQLGQQAFASFIIANKYSAYGLVGTFIALMVWVYYASAVVCMGAELVHAIAQVTAGRSAAGPVRN